MKFAKMVDPELKIHHMKFCVPTSRGGGRAKGLQSCHCWKNAFFEQTIALRSHAPPSFVIGIQNFMWKFFNSRSTIFVNFLKIRAIFLFFALPCNFTVKSTQAKIIFLTKNSFRVHLDLKEYFEEVPQWKRSFWKIKGTLAYMRCEKPFFVFLKKIEISMYKMCNFSILWYMVLVGITSRL